MNPFSLAPTPEHRHFLFAFVRVLLQSSGQYQLTLDDDRDLYEAIAHVYALDPGQRRLLTFTHLLPRPLAQSLHRWIQGGPYAEFFDHVEDTLTLQPFQCFDFAGLDAFPLVLEPLLFYVLHRASAVLDPARLTLLALDEAWRLVRDPIFKAYLTDALKTWRKQNAAVLLATQNSDDFGAPDLLRTVIESCPTKVFLANPGMDRDQTRARFHLNVTEAARIAQLIPRQQALIKRPDLSRVINLRVDPASGALLAGRPGDAVDPPPSDQPSRYPDAASW
jgi:type IV secretion system protein VirB4